jgi:hypothetical protein
MDGDQPMSKAPDPATILKVHYAADPPGLDSYFLCRKSMAGRLCRDAAGSGDEVTDIGPAFMLAQPASRAEFAAGEMILIGIAEGGRWLTWRPPAPVEPVPGSRGDAAARN